MHKALKKRVTNLNGDCSVVIDSLYIAVPIVRVFFVCVLSFFCRPVLLDFSLTVKAAPHECVIRTSQP